MAVTKWTIGADPGFKETGLVLRRSHEVVAWSTFKCKPNGSPYMRTTALAFAVIDRMMDWVRDYEIEALDVSVETPIYNSNARSFELQWRLVQEIESNLALLTSRQLWLTEVGPTTSKRLATGNGKADKESIFAASPFGLEVLGQDLHTQHTLADAWAHSLAAWEGCADCTRVRLDNYFNNLPDVKEICDGTI